VQAVLVAVDADSFLQIDHPSRPREEVEARLQELHATARSHGVPVATLSAEQDLEQEIGRADWLEAS
jgi:hypothetical protein